MAVRTQDTASPSVSPAVSQAAERVVERVVERETITAAEAARRLGLTKIAFYQAALRGEIPVIRLNGRRGPDGQVPAARFSSRSRCLTASCRGDHLR